MPREKQTCKILKDIRRQIAEANDIEFVTSECRYKGDCLGTCPKCEAEVRYLEQQLRSRQIMGKAVVLAGLSAGMIAFSGCGSSSDQTTNDSDTQQEEPTELLVGMVINDWEVEEEGEIEALESIKQGEVEDAEFNTGGEIIDYERKDSIYEVIVDARPSFPGGDQKLLEWISQHIQYPQNAYDSNIQGRVIVQFLIKADGTVGEAKVIKMVSDDLDKEALRVVSTLPRFNPAKLNGKAVDYWFTVPITFRLAD